MALAESRKTLPVAIGRRNDTLLPTANGRLGNYLRGESPFGTGERMPVVPNSEREDIVRHEFGSGDDFPDPVAPNRRRDASRDFQDCETRVRAPLVKI